MPDRRMIAAVFAGGAVGTLLRAALSVAFPLPAAQWPWPTFTVNIIGAFLLGYFTTRLQERLPLSSYRRPALGTGLCGALTTYSTFSYETLRLAEDGAGLFAVANVMVSVPAGLGAAFAGVLVGGAL